MKQYTDSKDWYKLSHSAKETLLYIWGSSIKYGHMFLLKDGKLHFAKRMETETNLTYSRTYVYDIRGKKYRIERCIPYFTIGQLFEILQSFCGDIKISHHNDLHIGLSFYTHYNFDGKLDTMKIYSSERWYIKEHSEQENQSKKESLLIDSLLEAVVKKVEHEKLCCREGKNE